MFVMAAALPAEDEPYAPLKTKRHDADVLGKVTLAL
jgi:hypothetical protein